MAIVWLVLGVVLLLVELRHVAFYALFVAVGSLVAAVTALVVPSAVPLQVAVAVVVSVAGVIAVRPAVSRAFPRHLGGHVARGVHGGLVGQEAVTLDVVDAAHHRGHVRLAGERWLAVSGSGALITAQTAVLVTAVEGTTLVVWPVDGGVAAPQPAALDEVPPDGADGRTT